MYRRLCVFVNPFHARHVRELHPHGAGVRVKSLSLKEMHRNAHVGFAMPVQVVSVEVVGTSGASTYVIYSSEECVRFSKLDVLNFLRNPGALNPCMHTFPETSAGCIKA